MKREIKFRAWDKDEQKMLRPSVEFKQLLRQISDRNDNSLGGDAIRRHDLEWMQFTGLKDKNGVEIYEGDVVMYGDNLYTVEWIGGSFAMNRKGHPGYLLEPHIEHAIKHVGNIYEHVHLLETKAEAL